jgi:hypothetical protein
MIVCQCRMEGLDWWMHHRDTFLEINTTWHTFGVVQCSDVELYVSYIIRTPTFSVTAVRGTFCSVLGTRLGCLIGCRICEDGHLGLGVIRTYGIRLTEHYYQSICRATLPSGICCHICCIVEAVLQSYLHCREYLCFNPLFTGFIDICCVFICLSSILLIDVHLFSNNECNFFFYAHQVAFGPGSSVGIATGYGLDGSGIESRWGRDFPHLSRPALGPTQHPVQWILGLSRG